MKKLLVFLLLLLMVLQAHSQKLSWIDFIWVGDSAGGRYLEKSAIDIPVKIEDMPYKFTAQLDLGSPSSMLYGNSITPYLEKGSILKSKIDTGLKTWLDSKQYPIFRGVNMQLDNVPFENIDLAYYKGYGDSLTEDSVKSNTVKEIGTIGSGFFHDKVLIIDYPNHRICVTDVIPKEFQVNGNIIDFKFVEGLIVIPVQIDGKMENLIFDSGSSIFSLNTNEKNANDISGNAAIEDSLKINSWGKYYYTYGKKVSKEVKIGNVVLPKTLVYYDKREWDYFFIRNNIWGITGNAYFFNNVVIVDFKNNKFEISGPVAK
jgi:hypothetical protein